MTIYWSAREKEQSHLALTMAELLAASVTYRAEPERFVEVRDSLLAARGVSREALQSFLEQDSAQAERYYDFVVKVDVSLDSILRKNQLAPDTLPDTANNAGDSASGK